LKGRKNSPKKPPEKKKNKTKNRAKTTTKRTKQARKQLKMRRNRKQLKIEHKQFKINKILQKKGGKKQPTKAEKHKKTDCKTSQNHAELHRKQLKIKKYFP
jgi:hypothetical protein